MLLVFADLPIELSRYIDGFVEGHPLFWETRLDKRLRYLKGNWIYKYLNVTHGFKLFKNELRMIMRVPHPERLIIRLRKRIQMFLQRRKLNDLRFQEANTELIRFFLYQYQHLFYLFQFHTFDLFFSTFRMAKEFHIFLHEAILKRPHDEQQLVITYYAHKRKCTTRCYCGLNFDALLTSYYDAKEPSLLVYFTADMQNYLHTSNCIKSWGQL